MWPVGIASMNSSSIDENGNYIFKFDGMEYFRYGIGIRMGNIINSFDRLLVLIILFISLLFQPILFLFMFHSHNSLFYSHSPPYTFSIPSHYHESTDDRFNTSLGRDIELQVPMKLFRCAKEDKNYENSPKNIERKAIGFVILRIYVALF